MTPTRLAAYSAYTIISLAAVGGIILLGKALTRDLLSALHSTRRPIQRF